MTNEEFEALVEIYNTNYRADYYLKELYKFIKVMATGVLLSSEDEEITDEDIDTYLTDNADQFTIENFTDHIKEFYSTRGIKNNVISDEDVITLLTITRERLKAEQEEGAANLDEELAKWGENAVPIVEEDPEDPVVVDDGDSTDTPVDDGTDDGGSTTQGDDDVQVITDGDDTGNTDDPDGEVQVSTDDGTGN